MLTLWLRRNESFLPLLGARTSLHHEYVVSCWRSPRQVQAAPEKRTLRNYALNVHNLPKERRQELARRDPMETKPDTRQQTLSSPQT